MEEVVTYGWGTANPVRNWLFDEAYRFDFYQAVRLLESIYPGKVSVGESSHPRDEVVRFRSSVGLSFPASEIADLTPPPEDGEPAGMTVNFLGLAGGLGPLTTVYTEMIIGRIGAKDRALEEFLNIFNHRLVSLMYRVRKVHRMALTTSSPEKGNTARHLFSLFGLGTRGLQNRLELPDRALLHYASILAQQPRTTSGLKMILGHYFQVAVETRELVGRWLKLDDEHTTTIGAGGRNNGLGTGALLGTKVWDQSGKFELRLGPMGYEKFREFLPGGSGYARLCSLTRFYVGTEMEFDVVLLLAPPEVPELRLSGSGSAFLGWTSWLATRPHETGEFRLRLSTGS